MKYLHHLTKDEYHKGANAALTNAKAHLKIAGASASLSHFGIGLSHLIIACEELSKASVLRIKFLDPGLLIKDLYKYFRLHTTKHNGFLKIFGFLLNLEVENKTLNPDSKSETEQENPLNATLACILIIIASFAIKSFSKEMAGINVDTFERLRQRGFYVDFLDDKRWMIPDEVISEHRYRTIATVIEKMFEAIELHLFNKEVERQQLSVLIQKLEELEATEI